MSITILSMNKLRIFSRIFKDIIGKLFVRYFFVALIVSLLFSYFGKESFLDLFIFVSFTCLLALLGIVFHEFAHAAVAYFFKGGSIIKGLSFNGFFSVNILFDRSQLRDLETIFLIYAAGPLSGLIVGIIFIPFLFFIPSLLIVWITGWILPNFFSLIPTGHSDGRKLLNLKSQLRWNLSDALKMAIKSNLLIFKGNEHAN